MAAPESGPPETRVAVVAQQALEAWNSRGLDGVVRVGDGEMPATFVVNIVCIELLVHAWDVADATGRQVEVSDGVTGYVLEMARQVISPEKRHDGSFAEAVDVGPDAQVLQRLIAFSGRAAA